jgi:cobalamin biosynthesis protein CbiD
MSLTNSARFMQSPWSVGVGSGVSVAAAVAVGSRVAETVRVTAAAGVGVGVEPGFGVSVGLQALNAMPVSSRMVNSKITIFVRFYNPDYLIPFEAF